MNEPPPTTEELIERIKTGQDVEYNFRLLFERHRNQIHRFFQRKGLPPEDCGELTQEVFLSIYRGMNGLRQPALFTAWMFAIVENVWRSHLEMIKAKKRLANLVSLDEEHETEDGESSSLADRLPDLAPGAFEFVLQQVVQIPALESGEPVGGPDPADFRPDGPGLGERVPDA